MDAKLTVGGKVHNIDCGMTIFDAMHSIGLMPDAFIFVIDGRPVPMDTQVADGMTVKALKVASGG